jgi:oligopeptide transport system substrate-binding protein
MEEQAGLLAHHWERAGDAEKAIHYLLRAGDRARALYAHEEATDFYHRALTLLRQGGDDDRAARTLMKLGLTYHTAFQFQRSREAYEEGLAVWQSAAEKATPATLPSAPHALRLVSEAWSTLDPGAWQGGTGSLIPQLFQGLVVLGPQLEVLPGLAHSWDVREGGREYVFRLQEGARWSDGAPVTADDVEFAWKRVLDPANEAPYADLLHDLEGAQAYHRGEVSDPDTVGVRALDGTTLVVNLEHPTGYFLQLLGQEATFPVPRHVVELHGEAWAKPGTIVTSGPFSLVDHRQDGLLVLERNGHYLGPWTGNVKRLEIVVQRTHNWRHWTALYEAGELDALIVGGFPIDVRDRLRQRHPDQFVSTAQLTTACLAFDVTQPPLDDTQVRQALTMAVDREVMAGGSFRGYLLPATGGYIPPGMPGHSPGIALPYDPEQARRLLAEAGYPRGSGFAPLAGLLVQGSGSSIAAAEYLEVQWRKELGVEVEWRYVPSSVFFDRVGQEELALKLAVWAADYPDPDNFLRVGFGHERTAWRHAEYDRLVGKARRLLNQRERMAMYRRADQIMVEEAPFLLLGYMQSQVLIKPWVKRCSVSPTGNLSQWKDVILEPH